MRDLPLPMRSSYHQFVLTKPNQAKRVQTLIESGRRLLEAGHNDEARRLFLQTLSIYPLVIPALNNLALIALREGDVARAIDVIHEVLQCDPFDPIAHSLAAQCWYYRESEPMVRAHVDTCLTNYIELTEAGDPVDPDYVERAFPFVFQALLMAEDDAGIISLHQAVPDHSWTALELTWVGVATFNRGRINDAHLIWRKAAKISRYEPALIYAALAQHILSEDLLPFTLDYELILTEDDDFVPYPPSTLTVAHLVNEVFRSNSQNGQVLLNQLVEHEMPAQDYFLRRLLRNGRLSPGVRMAAAVHLVWLGDDEPYVEKLAHEFDEENLAPGDLPVYYLLHATIAQALESPDSPTLHALIQKGRLTAKEAGCDWVMQCFADFFDWETDLVDPELADVDDVWDLFPSLGLAHDDASDRPSSSEPRDIRDKRGD